MPSDATLYDLTTDLRALGGGRVWSLMVSLFGDLAREEGDYIAGPVLSAIMTTLDVKPEAARVALHRLRNDGWITSAKAGRISHHSLSDEGRAKSRAASPRIYGSNDQGGSRWQLVMLGPNDPTSSEEMTALGFIHLQGQVFGGDRTCTPPLTAAVFDGGSAPAWLCAAAIPPALEQGYAKFATALDAIAVNLPDPAKLSALDTAVLRCLIVHNWRRLVLKHIRPPQDLVDPNGAYHRCLTRVGDLLARYPRPALDTLV